MKLNARQISELMARYGRRGGKVKSPAKTAAARKANAARWALHRKAKS